MPKLMLCWTDWQYVDLTADKLLWLIDIGDLSGPACSGTCDQSCLWPKKVK